MAPWLMNPTQNHEVTGSIPGLPEGVKDPVLLWLWCRPAATAPIRPLAWEPPSRTDKLTVELRNNETDSLSSTSRVWNDVLSTST